MFNLVDDVSESFQEQFSIAQNAHSKRAGRAAPAQERARDEVGEQQQAKAGDKAEEAHAQHKAEQADAAEEAEVVVEDVEVAVEEAEVDVEVEVVADADVQEVAVEDGEAVAEVQVEQAEDVQPVVVDESEGVAVDPDAEVDAQQVAEVEVDDAQVVADSDEDVEVEAAVEEVEPEPVEEAAVAPVEDQPKEIAEEDVQVEEVQLEDANVDPSQVARADVPVQAEAGQERAVEAPEAEQARVNRAEPQPVAQKVEHEALRQAEQRRSLPEPSLRQERAVESDEYSMVAEGEDVQIHVDEDQVERITKALDKIAERVRLQDLNPEKVSPQLLEGLKATNSQLADKIAQKVDAVKAATAQAARPAASAVKADVAQIHQQVQGQKVDFQSPVKQEQTRIQELRDRIVDQVRLQVRNAPSGSVGEISIRLRPQYLGNIKIVINVEDASAQARFVVENNTVRDLLQNSSGDLRSALEDQGIDVDAIDVEVAEEQGEFSEGRGAFASVEEQQAAREWIRSFVGARAELEELEDVVQPHEQSDGESMLNVVA